MEGGRVKKKKEKEKETTTTKKKKRKRRRTRRKTTKRRKGRSTLKKKERDNNDHNDDDNDNDNNKNDNDNDNDDDEEEDEEEEEEEEEEEPCLVCCVPGMDRQYTLCVLVPAHQYRTYVNNYHQQAHHQRLQQRQRQQYPEQQRSCKQPYQQEQIYENVVSQYRMRMCYHNDYENDEQIQRFYWEQCYRRDDTDATAYYYCEYAKKEIYDVKQQRLCLAQDEYNHLNNALTTLGASRTSLCSSSSSLSTKYDPDLLKSDVALARSRVSRLKRELEQIRAEMNCTQRGVDTLASVEQKLSGHHGGCYNITEAQAIMTELRNIQKSLSSGEKEKAELMQSLAQLKDELTRLQLCEGSPEASTLSLPQEKLSTASQTDLSGELVPIGTRLAEMARMRLQYDEARKRIQHIQQQLADLEEKVTPGQTESDKDKLLLFQEKEQLLRELRSITPRTRTQQDMKKIQSEIRRLEQDLNNALELSNKTITDRVRLHEEKQLLLQQLRDALRSMAMLEGQLKTLSASTLSVSSSSSLGSLSTTSSKGSLSSGLSFTDIYGGPQCLGPVSSQQERPVDMVDLHRRVERLLRGSEQNNLASTPSPGRSQPSLSPRSSLSSVSPPVSPLYENAPMGPPPAYEHVEMQRRQHQRATTSSNVHLDGSQLEDRLAELRLTQQQTSSHEQFCVGPQDRLKLVGGPHPPVELQSGNMSQGSGLGRPVCVIQHQVPSQEPPPLSPISETPPPTGIRSRASSSGTNTRSVSAAVSDESVAGDSGVFEASNRRKFAGAIGDVNSLSLGEMSLETAQVQIKLRYIKAALLPMQPPVNHMCCTKPVVDLRKPTFGETFPIAVPLNKLYTKTLQVNVWCTGSESEECLGSAQVSLADFSPESPSVKWYNILSFRFMQPSDSPSTSTSNSNSISISVTRQAKHDKQESDLSMYRVGQNTKEESSDESTIISSQTSTLTRNQGCDELQTAISLRLEELANCLGSPEEEDENGGSESGSEDSDEEGIIVEFTVEDNVLEDVLEHEEDEELNEEARQTQDKETNTECVFIPEQGKQRKLSAAGVVSSAMHDDKNSIVIKRSQTFSPSAAVSKNHYICRHRRHASEPVTTEYMVNKLGAQGVLNLTSRSNSVPSGNASMVKTDGAATNNATTVTNVIEDVPANSTNKPVNAKGRSTEANVHCQENGQGGEKSTEENDGEEPRRLLAMKFRVLHEKLELDNRGCLKRMVRNRIEVLRNMIYNFLFDSSPKDEIILIEHLPGRRVHLQDFFWSDAKDAPPWVDANQGLTFYETRTVYHTVTLYSPTEDKDNDKPLFTNSNEPKCTTCIEPTPRLDDDEDQNIGVLIGEDPGPRRLSKAFGILTRDYPPGGLAQAEIVNQEETLEMSPISSSEPRIQGNSDVLLPTTSVNNVENPRERLQTDDVHLKKLNLVQEKIFYNNNNLSTTSVNFHENTTDYTSQQSLQNDALTFKSSSTGYNLQDDGDIQDNRAKTLRNEILNDINSESINASKYLELRSMDHAGDEIVQVRMQNTSVTESGATKLIYSVHLGGKPVPAETAARDMALLSPQEVALELGAPVLIQSELENRAVNEKMFNFMKKATEKDDKEKRKREKKERKDVKKRDRSSMSAEELLRLDEVRRSLKIPGRRKEKEKLPSGITADYSASFFAYLDRDILENSQNSSSSGQCVRTGNNWNTRTPDGLTQSDSSETSLTSLTITTATSSVTPTNVSGQSGKNLPPLPPKPPKRGILKGPRLTVSNTVNSLSEESHLPNGNETNYQEASNLLVRNTLQNEVVTSASPSADSLTDTTNSSFATPPFSLSPVGESQGLSRWRSSASFEEQGVELQLPEIVPLELPEPRELTIQRQPPPRNDFGFSLRRAVIVERAANGVTQMRPVIFAEPGSLIQHNNDTGLLPGDRLIEVNGINVDDKSREEIIDLIKGSVNSVTVKVGHFKNMNV
ncbi:hypothetical protein E2986_12623 [Frieseomelitta varia]|uniref:Protein kibra n=2 Tax=Frieseomelitta varia TaxID=561572 RepID=A0A833RQX7_9HYME|nr:hypothetical protein E2986_12623 [Frieseomelitta varia]